MERPDLQVLGGDDTELVTRVPPPALRPYLRRYSGWNSPAAQIHPRVMPNADVVVVINFAAPLIIDDPLQPGTRRYQSLLAGLRRTWAGTAYDGATGGFQLDFRPIGAYLLLGIPMHEVADRMIDFDELGDLELRELAARLPEEPDWTSRFDLVDRLLTDRLTRAFERDPMRADGVLRAWDLLTASQGRVDIDRVVAESDYSHRHLISLFRERVGVTPKLVGRILRFHRATRMLASGYPHGMAALAAECGYYDQAHMVRDFRALGGCTPGTYLDSVWPQLDMELDAQHV
ncbi:AraC family transcriptional regulator [Fodinicola acaciae]|uniref:AraC family transcriptional regulator n=1 Tax=Fodinicola acaciae TaxID=2681555 RepID=UPI0013D6C76D|nr:helix-turn-helix domain-containing protein [Fodinicola acaciae]